MSTAFSCKDSTTAECLPGETRLCADPDLDCQGAQACNADGLGWGACDCEAPRGPLAGPDTTPEGTATLIGRGCVADPECGEGLRCVTAGSDDFLGVGGVAGGYCTTDCTLDADCLAFDPDSECLVTQPGAEGLCLRTCFSKDPALGEGKCGGREDLVCNSVVAQGEAQFSPARQPGQCRPMCRSDSDCPGRFCSLRIGLCVDEPPAGAPIGGLCDDIDSCQGARCLALDEEGTTAMCTASCRLNLDPPTHSCGSNGETGPVNTTCLVPQVSVTFLGSEGNGDLGFCFQLCDTDADCSLQAEGYGCVPVDRVRDSTGRVGACFTLGPASDAGAPDAGADAGTDAGADAGADGGASPSTPGAQTPTK